MRLDSKRASWRALKRQVRCRLPHTKLSAPFKALTLDLQQRVDALTTLAAEGNTTHTSKLQWESEESLSIPASREGVWNGVAFWFKVGQQPYCQPNHRD